jgi:phosphocarrier protein HPr
MTEMSATIRNDRGIHVRPACVIYKAVEQYKGNITLSYMKQEISLTSIMDLICLGLGKGDMVHIRVDGTNERVECSRLVELFETHFDYPPREEERTA